MTKLNRRSISQRTVEALRVEKDTVFWDRRQPGFGVRVYASDTKMYVAQARTKGKSVRVTVGRHGVISADEARRRAARILNLIGVNPIFHAGLSPRGRGNPEDDNPGEVADGSIPARAGEPTGCAVRGRARWVYPRAGGGTRFFIQKMPAATGLSPRGRGNQQLRGRGRVDDGSIPARAGEPSCRRRRRGRDTVYPRAGGGTGNAYDLSSPLTGLSPRGRGNQRGPWL